MAETSEIELGSPQNGPGDDREPPLEATPSSPPPGVQLVPPPRGDDDDEV